VASWLDVDTLVLLFGMMALVGYLARTGVFEYIAARIFARVGRSPGRLVGTLCVAASVLSAFLDNVTVVLLITPITVSLCKSMGLPAERVVLAMVFSSNIGGAATLVGDPPNLMIASQLGTKGITFGKFSLHVAPCVVLCMCGTLVYLKGVFVADLAPEARKRRLLEQHHHMQALLKDVEDEECAPGGAASTAVTPSPTSTPKQQPRGSGAGMLVDDGPALSIATIMSSGSSARAAFEAQAVALQRRYPIRDRDLLRSTAPVFACVVLGLCLCSPLLQIELAWIPIVGVGAVSLLDSSEGGLEAVLAHIEWSTLLFFGALAILMRGITTLGLIQFLGNGLAHLIAHVPPTLQLPAALLIVLWGSATLSACIDNVPFTAAMIPIVQRLVETNGLPLQPLVTVLALGTCLGGNGSLIAASANIVAAGILEGLGMPINFKDFARLGVPVAFITISISSVYVIVLYVLIGVR
jgi:Na+/H+ antiporter NhaD/arsenite permease-like protein